MKECIAAIAIATFVLTLFAHSRITTLHKKTLELHINTQKVNINQSQSVSNLQRHVLFLMTNQIRMMGGKP